MRKNLMSVLILALVLINTIMMAVMMISIIPSLKKSNAMIDQVAGAISLELYEDGEGGGINVPMSQVSTFELEEELTINLKADDDGKDHYAIVKVSIAMDTKHEDYKTYGETISEKGSLIRNEVISVVSSYTYDDFRSNQTEVQEEILDNLRSLFDSDFIVSVGFSSVTCQ